MQHGERTWVAYQRRGHHLGVRDADGLGSVVRSGAAVFTTVEDGQTEVAIKVLALDRGKTDLLSSFELAGLTPLRAGMAQIVVTFHLDEDLVLRVTAHDRLGNQTEQIYIRDRLPTPPHDARRRS